MEITYHSGACVRLRGRDTQVVIDPAKATGSGVASKGSNYFIVKTEGLTTDPNKLRAHGDGPQIVSGPGEYEVSGVSVNGWAADGNTVMKVEVDSVRVVALGALARQLTEDEIETLGSIDVLLVPVGGNDALDAADAVKLIREVEPSVVVPIRYSEGKSAADRTNGKYDSVDKFAAEMGLPDKLETQPKLNLTGALGAGQDTRVVVLEARH